MDQNQGRSRACLEIAHAAIGKFDPLLVNMDIDDIDRSADTSGALYGKTNGGWSEFFVRILSFGRQRIPHRQSLTKQYRPNRFLGSHRGSPFLFWKYQSVLLMTRWPVHLPDPTTSAQFVEMVKFTVIRAWVSTGCPFCR